MLGILERREGRRVGADKTFQVDVRIIAATNRDLAAESARGAFRADLYYRLAVVELRLPSLRERPEDIPILIDHLRGTDRLKPGSTNMLVGFGVGWSWAGCVWKETWSSVAR